MPFPFFSQASFLPLLGSTLTIFAGLPEFGLARLPRKPPDRNVSGGFPCFTGCWDLKGLHHVVRIIPFFADRQPPAARPFPRIQVLFFSRPFLIYGALGAFLLWAVLLAVPLFRAAFFQKLDRFFPSTNPLVFPCSFPSAAVFLFLTLGYLTNGMYFLGMAQFFPGKVRPVPWRKAPRFTLIDRHAPIRPSLLVPFHFGTVGPTACHVPKLGLGHFSELMVLLFHHVSLRRL